MIAGARDIINLAQKINNTEGVYDINMEGLESTEDSTVPTMALTAEQKEAADKAKAEAEKAKQDAAAERAKQVAKYYRQLIQDRDIKIIFSEFDEAYFSQDRAAENDGVIQDVQSEEETEAEKAAKANKTTEEANGNKDGENKGSTSSGAGSSSGDDVAKIGGKVPAPSVWNDPAWKDVKSYYGSLLVMSGHYLRVIVDKEMVDKQGIPKVQVTVIKDDCRKIFKKSLIGKDTGHTMIKKTDLEEERRRRKASKVPAPSSSIIVAPGEAEETINLEQDQVAHDPNDREVRLSMRELKEILKDRDSSSLNSQSEVFLKALDTIQTLSKDNKTEESEDKADQKPRTVITHQTEIEEMTDDMQNNLCLARYLPTGTDLEFYQSKVPEKTFPVRSNYSLEEYGLPTNQVKAVHIAHSKAAPNTQLKTFSRANLAKVETSYNFSVVKAGKFTSQTDEESISNCGDALQALFNYLVLRR